MIQNKNYQNVTRSFVNEILAKKNLAALPIDIEQISRSIGLNVVEYPFQEDISGVLVINEKGATIGYNANESSVRRRFSIAHELGHFILHSEKNATGMFMDRLLFRKNITTYSTKEESIEREANFFAANLLMPEELVVSEVNKLNPNRDDDENIKLLAKKFDVSVSAMTYRLVNLGMYK